MTSCYGSGTPQIWIFNHDFRKEKEPYENFLSDLTLGNPAGSFINVIVEDINSTCHDLNSVASISIEECWPHFMDKEKCGFFGEQEELSSGSKILTNNNSLVVGGQLSNVYGEVWIGIPINSKISVSTSPYCLAKITYEWYTPPTYVDTTLLFYSLMGGEFLLGIAGGIIIIVSLIGCILYVRNVEIKKVDVDKCSGCKHDIHHDKKCSVITENIHTNCRCSKDCNVGKDVCHGKKPCRHAYSVRKSKYRHEIEYCKCTSCNCKKCKPTIECGCASDCKCSTCIKRKWKVTISIVPPLLCLIVSIVVVVIGGFGAFLALLISFGFYFSNDGWDHFLYQQGLSHYLIIFFVVIFLFGGVFCILSVIFCGIFTVLNYWSGELLPVITSSFFDYSKYSGNSDIFWKDQVCNCKSCNEEGDNANENDVELKVQDESLQEKVY